MKTKRSIMVFIAGLVQTTFWTPYLFDPPWTLPESMRFGRSVLWSGFHFDLGRATDFVPAIAMVIAGVLAMTVGLRPELGGKVVCCATRAETIAVLVLVGMLGIRTFEGVVHWTPVDGWLLLTVLLWVGPPVASIILLTRAGDC